MKRVVFIGAIILLLFISLVAYYRYNQPRQNIAAQDADVTINAAQLYQQYNEHEPEANQKYLDKIVEVKGKVSEVQNNNSLIVLLINAGDGIGGINCSMKDKNFGTDMLQLKDKEVVVKGKCSGFLMDVNLVDCVLIQPKSK
ncbi:MAG: OB-fold putative lipoprotein [Chitinophagaceae bacterium]|nr:OB-fold putative lipoprotein [Chitinophagaceae bacterium]